ncbi:hypothetical protein SEA_CANDLE_88 [Mycobacterium phage Candle]|uniref:Uncharacterized protein n=1 Tax=Mycobacterium phage Candle TaxID=2565513 RepID=A0A4D6T902_9CAUD|nr:hypothetical protein SEA_CANDLE_88 [Mycobacterium phage Candle]
MTNDIATLKVSAGDKREGSKMDAQVKNNAVDAVSHAADTSFEGDPLHQKISNPADRITEGDIVNGPVELSVDDPAFQQVLRSISEYGSPLPLWDDSKSYGSNVIRIAQQQCDQCRKGNCPGHVAEMAMPERYGAKPYDAVSPPHYQRGPRVFLSDHETAEFYDIQCIDVFRHMQDPRLATAFKYIWRVAFGGKAEPWDSRTQVERDARDIKSAIWYLEDYVANPVEPLADLRAAAYDALKARLQAAEAKLADKQAEGKGTQQD